MGTLFLFGFVAFVQLQNAFWTPDNNRSVGLMILENFRDVFRIGAFVLFIFLMLHLVQWFVSSWIRKALFAARTPA
jgi:hypothetical protein